MNRQETDDEARATKNTKNVWKWILGVGIALMAIAFWGGFFNHNENFKEAETPSVSTQPAEADSVASDTVGQLSADTVMRNVRGTK